MTEEIVIDGELSCNNCLEKTRCKQQQEVKVKRMDAILSYITNKDNEKYIAELKNEIPAITRCDVVLEKQLKRLEKENKKLKKRLDSYAISATVPTVMYNECEREKCKYGRALEEIKNDFMCFRSCMIPFHVGNKENLPHKMADAIQNYCESIKNKINEVLGNEMDR